MDDNVSPPHKIDWYNANAMLGETFFRWVGYSVVVGTALAMSKITESKTAFALGVIAVIAFILIAIRDAYAVRKAYTGRADANSDSIVFSIVFIFAVFLVYVFSVLLRMAAESLVS